MQVLEDCNREVGNMKQMEELVHIANKTEFECKVCFYLHSCYSVTIIYMHSLCTEQVNCTGVNDHKGERGYIFVI